MINMSPKISIVIPSYNEKKNISRCLDSVLNQTFTDFEVICVDDGSSDGTFDIIKNYSKKDSRIIPLKNPGKGVSSARNFGIENSSGDYIGFVDSDDFIQPQMYEFLYKAVTENSCDFSVCRYKNTSCFSKESFKYKTNSFQPEKFISFDNMDFNAENELVFSSACTKLISKNLLKTIKFKNYKIGEDTVFNSEIYLKADKIIFVDAELYNYFINTQSVTRTEDHSEKWFDLLQTRFVCYDFLKEKNKVLSSFYLERGMKSLLSYRFNLADPASKKKNKKIIKNYFKNYLLSFMKCESISLKNKFFISLFSLFPFLYKMFRKMKDKTL